MTPYLQDADFTLHVGDALQVLRTLPDESVDCCVTSPPYWGLRDYGTGTWEGGDEGCDHKNESTVLGNTRRNLAQAANRADGGDRIAENRGDHDGDHFAQYRDVCGKCGATRVDRQLGLEATPGEYVARMIEVFREVRRVLVARGTCWVNLGDSYAAGGNGARDAERWPKQSRNAGGARSEHSKKGHNVKPKDLVGIPWRVAFALQADGWYLRSDIIWSKPNPMPESVTDRPTKAHEYVFLLTKRPRYYYDADAIREAYQPSSIERSKYAVNDMRSSVVAHDGGVRMPTGDATVLRSDLRKPQPVPQSETLDGSDGESPRGPDGRRATRVLGKDGSEQHRDGERWPNPTGRNARSVWEIATQPYPDAHFATFPEELARRCILAGSPERVCRTCGKPSERLVAIESRPNWQGSGAQKHDGTYYRENPGGGVGNDARNREHVGWSDCGHNDWHPGTVLDPFLGSGTTALVARKHGRHSIGIELSPEYAELAARRLQQLSLLAEGAA